MLEENGPTGAILFIETPTKVQIMDMLNALLPRLMARAMNSNLPVPSSLLIRLEAFVRNNPKRTMNFLLSIKPSALESISRRKAALVANEAIDHTPALREFYSKNGFEGSIGSFSDFQRLPETNKNNYTEAYPLESRCAGRMLPPNGSIYESAGTSGKPTIWLQSLNEINEFKKFASFAMDYTFDICSKKYIILNCWAFGTWPTAIDFTFSVEELSQVVNVGTDTGRALEILQSLGTDKEYIIAGYPPFLRNLADEGAGKGMDWKKFRIHIITGGEGFVEEWRDEMAGHLGRNSIIRSAYGSTDKGLGEGFETELTIAVRRAARLMAAYAEEGRDEAKKISRRYFNSTVLPKNKESAVNFLKNAFKVDPSYDSRIPMVFQYDPATYLEEEVVNKTPDGKEITEFATTVLKPGLTIPRIRFNVKDQGTAASFNSMKDIIEKHLVEFEDFVNAAQIDKKKILPLPFLFVFGRSDGTISIDGSKIYPEETWAMIQNTDELRNSVNSFVMFITEDRRLGIAFELKRLLKAAGGIYYKNLIRNGLAKYSAGFRALVDERLKSANLEIRFHGFGEGPFSESPSTKARVKYVYTSKKAL